MDRCRKVSARDPARSRSATRRRGDPDFKAAKITGSIDAHNRPHVGVDRPQRVFRKQPASKGLEKRFKRRLRNERPSPSLGDGCAVDGEQRLNPSANLESDDVEVTRAFRENDLGYRWN